MLEKFLGRFNKAQQDERMALKPDEPDKKPEPINFKKEENPNFVEQWMEKASEDGESGGVTQEFAGGKIVENVLDEPAEEEPVPVLTLIKGGKTEEVQPVAVEKIDPRQSELTDRLNRAQAQFEAAQAELKQAQAEMEAYAQAKEKVQKAA